MATQAVLDQEIVELETEVEDDDKSFEDYQDEEEAALLLEDDYDEMIEGEKYKMSAPNPVHGIITGNIYRALLSHIDASFGRVVSNMGFKLAPKTEVLPDVAFVNTQHWNELSTPKIFNGAPDLAIEINSPSDTTERIHKKIQSYIKANTRLIWSIYPLDGYVIIYEAGQAHPILLNQEQELDGKEVIPGFKLIIKALFE